MNERHRNSPPIPSRPDDPVAPCARDIPRDEWRAFLDAFSRTHQEWLVDVRTSRPDYGVQLIVHDRPLEGITFDGEQIAIELGLGAETHFTHVVEHPEALSVELADGHVERSLAIKTGEGSVAVRFRSALPLEMVDGIT